MSLSSYVEFWENSPRIEVESFSDQEAESLGRVLTNTAGNVFVWKIGNELTQEQIGALLSRYSRTSFTTKRLFIKEFLPNKDRGKEFFESWLVDYGDDSIQEMVGGLPASCEHVSMVAAKEIEDCRLGSYIEKSTRYVAFDKKMPDGNYMFYRDKAIMESRYGDEYMSLMTALFDSYSKNMAKMTKYILEINPIENQSFRVTDTLVKINNFDKSIEEKYGVTEQDLRKAYENAAKANALDLLRDYLPMSTLTHLGISANARVYENLITKMLSSPLDECRWIGQRLNNELKTVVPSLMKRIEEKSGAELREFVKSKNSRAFEASKNFFKAGASQEKPDVDLAYYTGMETKNPNQAAQDAITAAILYRNGPGHSMSEIKEIISKMSDREKGYLISAYVGERKNRRHRPGRAFENVEYMFDLKGRVGIWRDIQRHRMGTQERQPIGISLGYNTRKDFADVGIKDDYESLMSRVKELYTKVYETLPYQAQYIVTFGFNMRWYYRMNARQLFHFCELRTTPGGHPDYRALVQNMYKKVSAVHPAVTEYMNYINTQERSLGRLESETRIAVKRRALGT